MTQITIYSKPGCMQCKQTARVMTMKGIEFTYVEDVTLDDEGMAFMAQHGYRSLPAVRAGDDHWSGFNPAKIEEVAARLAAQTPEPC
ncbi:glutaredoxin family protein [Paracoccus litorisediminis]|uniref:glutaredoxin family protein n=1 Tax=Paracoccus litorisediminis TaxID=2006130 RepID=UPI0037326DA8